MKTNAKVYVMVDSEGRMCEISGLPLRDDDETVEWGDGETLACLAKNAR